jgi:phospholipase C
VPSVNRDGTLAGKSTLPLDGEYFSDPERKYLAADDTVSGELRPWGLSARVPMYVVSPWSRGGWVCSQVFDHTSLALFLEQRFDITVPNVSPWHRAVCGDLTAAFDFSGAADAAALALPDTGNYAALEAQQRAMPGYLLPQEHEALFQESGTRPSRALPYALQVDAILDAGRSLSLDFRNEGNQGAVFHVYDKLHLDRIPRRYTVEAGKQLADLWTVEEDDGAYDLWVYGPNGFVRHFRSTRTVADAQPEWQLGYQAADGAIELRLQNHGSSPIRLELRDEVYGHGGPWTLTLAGGETATRLFALESSHYWYDFSVKDTDDSWSRRCAGRVETGAHGLSDPAMGTA